MAARAGSGPRFLFIVSLFIAPLLGGCAGGDFGRTRASALNDDMHDWMGKETTASVGRPASSFQLTDAERLLRDSAYPFVEPPASRPAWKSVFGDYQPIAAPWRQKVRFDHTAYGKMLIDEPHRSHASRYGVLMDDVRNDLTRFDTFVPAAMRVLDLDGKRAKSLSFISQPSRREVSDALARIDENNLVVEWVRICLEQRVQSYRWALERLVIHAPDPVAAEAERLITELATRLSAPPFGAGRGAVVVSKG